MRAWRDLDLAAPVLAGMSILVKTKVRRDKIDKTGTVTLLYQSKMHHISLGRKFKTCRVIILMADLDPQVMTTEGEMLRHFTLNPSKIYQARYLDTLEGSRVQEDPSHHHDEGNATMFEPPHDPVIKVSGQLVRVEAHRPLRNCGSLCRLQGSVTLFKLPAFR